MTQSNLRRVIREIIEEELESVRAGAAKSPGVREEEVAIESDADLSRFVSRVLQLAANPQSRAVLQSGQHVFRLRQHGQRPPMSSSSSSSSVQREEITRVNHGLFTERDVKRLSDGVRVLQVGKSVRITPLAADELRRQGINIKRAKS